MNVKHNTYKYLQLLLLLLFLVQCQSNTSIEQAITNSNAAADTLTVSSFSIERTKDSALANWKAFEINDDVVLFPPDWVVKKSDDSFVLIPCKEGENERFIFNKYRKPNQDFDSDKFALQIVNRAFKGFDIDRSDNLQKAELMHGSFYERKAALLLDDKSYTGYCMAFREDSMIYEYNILFSKLRLSSYKGDLLKDIIGNLQINHHFIINNNNRINKLVLLKK